MKKKLVLSVAALLVMAACSTTPTSSVEPGDGPAATEPTTAAPSSTEPTNSAEEAQASAKAEADRIVAEAKAEADRITAKAKAEADRKVKAEANRKAKETADRDAAKAEAGSTASFRHFAVTVSQVKDRADQILVKAEVCVTRASDPQGTRISLGPWSISAGSQKTDADAGESTFPSDGTYEVGECASGWIVFASGPPDIIEYSNGLGDVAVWDADNLAEKPEKSRRVVPNPDEPDKSDAGSGSASGIGDGSYLVGSEIKPGTWKSSGVKDGLCYADTQNEDGDILQQEVAAEGSVIIRITEKAYTFKSSGCVGWKKVG